MAFISAGSVYIFMDKKHKKRKKRGHLIFTLFNNDIKIKGEIMAITLTSTQFVEGQLQPVDSKGRPAKVEAGSVEFTSSNEDVFIVEQDPNDETKLRIVAVGEGTGQLDYSADADLGQGVRPIAGFTSVEVLAPSAVGFGLTFGEPQEQEGSGSTTSTTTL